MKNEITFGGLALPGLLEQFISGVGPARVCNVADCPNQARWIPEIQIWAKGEKNPHAKNCAGLRFDLMLCDQHKETQTSDNFFTSESRARIKKVFSHAGLAPPDLKHCKIRWTEYKSKVN